MDREHSCESFALVLKTMHQSLLQSGKSLALELGVVDREVVQAFRTDASVTARALKNALRNVYPTCRLQSLPDQAFAPDNASNDYFADVDLKNDLYSIRLWQQLLTQSDPLSTLLGALSVNEHSNCFCLLYTSPSPRDQRGSRMPSSA